MDRAEIVAADVERSVVVQEPRARPLRHPAAEAEILPETVLLRAFGHECVADILLLDDDAEAFVIAAAETGAVARLILIARADDRLITRVCRFELALAFEVP